VGVAWQRPPTPLEHQKVTYRNHHFDAAGLLPLMCAFHRAGKHRNQVKLGEPNEVWGKGLNPKGALSSLEMSCHTTTEI